MKNVPITDNLIQIADALAAQFGQNCEVAIHDLLSKDPEHTLLHIVNGNVTGRKQGDSLSKIVLESMEKLAKGEPLESRFAYHTSTLDGRLLKSSTIFLNDHTGKPRYILAINFDITGLVHIEENLKFITGVKDNNEDSVPIPGTVADLLDDLLRQSAKLVGKEPALMSKDEKIRAIRFLNDSGAFLIMKSGDRIAEFFGLSKYTLYSYAEINKPH